MFVLFFNGNIFRELGRPFENKFKKFKKIHTNGNIVLFRSVKFISCVFFFVMKKVVTRSCHVDDRFKLSIASKFVLNR